MKEVLTIWIYRKRQRRSDCGMLGGNVYPPDSNREENSETNGSYWILQIAAYGFLAIISLITVLNIKNSISMGVSARVKQYGAVRAVGMENRQVKYYTNKRVRRNLCVLTPQDFYKKQQLTVA